MKVIVEIITGTFIDMQVSEDATVKELKEKIAAEVKLPVKRLILVVGDEETRRVVMENEDEMMLRELGVRECSHMYLFFKHPDLASREERYRGEEGDDDPMEEMASEAESGRGNEEEEKAKIDGEEEEEDEAMKDEDEDRDEKVEQNEEGKKEKNGEEEKDDDDAKEEAREGEEGDNKEEIQRVS